jgi:hypothetical protein
MGRGSARDARSDEPPRAASAASRTSGVARITPSGHRIALKIRHGRATESFLGRGFSGHTSPLKGKWSGALDRRAKIRPSSFGRQDDDL